MAAGEVLAGCDHRVPVPTQGTKKKGEFKHGAGRRDSCPGRELRCGGVAGGIWWHLPVPGIVLYKDIFSFGAGVKYTGQDGA